MMLDTRIGRIFVSLIGVAVILVGLQLKNTYPREIGKMPVGFSNPITAFEFLQTDQEVLDLFGTDQEQQKVWVNQMNEGHQVDYFFIVVYCLFLMIMALYYANDENRCFVLLIVVVSLFIGIFDVLENLELTLIANTLETKSFSIPLQYLFIFTWLKWGGLALALYGVSHYIALETQLGKIIKFLSLITIVLGIVAFFHRSIATTLFSKGILFQFVLLTIISIINIFKKAPLHTKL